MVEDLCGNLIKSWLTYESTLIPKMETLQSIATGLLEA